MDTMAYLKPISEEIVKGMDEDGVVADVRVKNYVLVEGNIKYFSCFTQLNHIVKKIKRLPVMKVIHWIGCNIPYERNIIHLNLTTKEEIAEEMAMSLSGVERAITVLKDEFFLMPYGTKRSASYKVNPVYVWYGNIEGPRRKAMKDFLENIRQSKLPEKEKIAVEMIKRYKEPVNIEVYKYDFAKIPVPQYTA
jgi:hypothetical protein